MNQNKYITITGHQSISIYFWHNDDKICYLVIALNLQS